MTTYITTFITSQGIPQTGLTPTLVIRDASDGSLVVNGAALSEVGGGVYRYLFTYDVDKTYTVVVDGTAALDPSERYQFSNVPEITRITPGRIC